MPLVARFPLPLEALVTVVVQMSFCVVVTVFPPVVVEDVDVEATVVVEDVELALLVVVEVVIDAN